MRKTLWIVSAVLLGWGAGLEAQDPGGHGLASNGSTVIPFQLVSGTFGLWRGGAFVVVRDRFSAEPVLTVFDGNGRELSRYTFTIPGAGRVNLYDNSVARARDGSLAIIGSVYDYDSHGASFLALISPDGRQQVVVRLSPFSPYAVTVASDHTIWVAGYNPHEPPAERDYGQHLIRRYDRNGKLLGSFLPWSSVRTPPRTLPAARRSILLSSLDRVGWYSPTSANYVEFALDGTILNWMKTPGHPTNAMVSAALCDDGSLFVSSANVGNQVLQEPASWEMFSLDRPSKEWRSIPRPEPWGMLYGCDGTRLAITTDHALIRWHEPSKN